jgi:hypothetical protein
LTRPHAKRRGLAGASEQKKILPRTRPELNLCNSGSLRSRVRDKVPGERWWCNHAKRSESWRAADLHDF